MKTNITILLLLLFLVACTKQSTAPATPQQENQLKSGAISPPSVQGVHLITIKQAHDNLANYLLKAQPEIVNAFTIDIQQINTAQILFQNPSVTAIRIYQGDDGTFSICGVNSRGKDLTAVIYSVPVGESGLCPFVCDNDSPIMQNPTK